MSIYVAVKETDKERLLGAYSRLDDAYHALKEQTNVRPLSYVRQALKMVNPMRFWAFRTRLYINYIDLRKNNYGN